MQPEQMQQMQDSIQSSLFSAGITTVVSLVVAFLIFVAVMRYVRRLSGANLKGGTPASATIVRMWDTGATVNDHPVAGLELDVQPAGGAAYRTSITSMIPRLAAARYQPGAIVPVRVDPRNPQRVALDLTA
jgi:hypothetical protein